MLHDFADILHVSCFYKFHSFVASVFDFTKTSNEINFVNTSLRSVHKVGAEEFLKNVVPAGNICDVINANAPNFF